MHEITPYYGLPLRGAGTRHVESLSSYIGRLAYAHRVTESDLLNDLANRSGRLRTPRPHCTQAVLSRGLAMDGATKLAQSLTDGLSKWTGQSTLGQASFGFLRDQIANTAQQTLRQHRAWCPECYRKLEPEDVADPLIWRLEYIAFCPEHDCKLMHICPTCDCEQPLVCWPIRRSRCYACNSSLIPRRTVTFRGCLTSLPPAFRAEHVWRSSQIQELIERHTTSDDFDNLPVRQFSEFIVELARLWSVTPPDIARAIGKPDFCYGIVNQCWLPSLDVLLNVCSRTRLNATGVLLYPKDAAAAVQKSDLPLVVMRHTRAILREQHLANLPKLAALRRVVSEWPEETEPSLAAMCEALKLKPSCVCKHAPELARAIQAMRNGYFSSLKRASIQRALQVCKQIHTTHPLRLSMVKRIAQEARCTWSVAEGAIAEHLGNRNRSTRRTRRKVAGVSNA